MSSNITSEVTIIDNKTLIGYDISWSGSSPVGMMSVQVSNTFSENPNGTIRNPGTWTTLTLSAPTPVSGNTGNGFIDIDITGAYAIRLVYTRTSGTGTLNAVICAKVT
jgi:hypothetical protein